MTEPGACSQATTTTSPPEIRGAALASSGRFSRIQSAATSTARANMGRSRDASKGNPEPPNPQIRPATAARVRRPRGVLRVRSRLNGRPRPRAGPPRGRGSLSASAQAVARDLGIPCSAAIRDGRVRIRRTAASTGSRLGTGRTTWSSRRRALAGTRRSQPISGTIGTPIRPIVRRCRECDRRAARSECCAT